jgi:hypothetical protein
MIPQRSVAGGLDREYLEIGSQATRQISDLVERTLGANMAMSVADQRQSPLRGRVGSSGTAEQHRCFLDPQLPHHKLREFAQHKGVARSLKKMSAQQPLGISAIARIQRLRCLLEHQRGSG